MGFNPIMMALSNDYTDRKSIRTEKTKVDVIPKTALEQWAEERFAPTVFSIKEMFVEGDTYLVTTDSGTFTAVCKKKLVEGIDMALLGNGNKYDLEDTGESFGVATILYPGQGVIGMAFDYNNGAFIEVSKVVETIDPKFLPGVCLPVVELREDLIMEIIQAGDTLVSGGTGLSCSEGPMFEQFEKAYNQCVPCVLQAFEGDSRASQIMPLESCEVGEMYSGKVGPFDFFATRTQNNGLVWEFKLTEAV